MENQQKEREKELLDLETSFEELKNLSIADYIVLPINTDIDKFQEQINKLKFPLWIKLNSGEHKLKLGAVKKCFDFEELKKTYNQFKKKFPGKKFIIQKNTEGFPIIVGIKQDKTFGKVLLLGTGGSLTEVIKDTAFRILPLEKEEIALALKQLKICKILIEKKSNMPKLISLIKDFSDLSEKSNITEADLNPVIINEKEAVIVDARVRI